jgi:hypothetical protein
MVPDGPSNRRNPGQEDSMQYKPVTRVVTVEFDKEKHGEGYGVRVTPECLVLRFGDKISWHVQGLPRSLATKVTFKNFRPIELAGRVLVVKKGPRKGLVKHLVRGFETSEAVVGANFHATAKSGPAELGRWKYDIFFDKQLLVDPEGEIKGPRK